MTTEQNKALVEPLSLEKLELLVEFWAARASSEIEQAAQAKTALQEVRVHWSKTRAGRLEKKLKKSQARIAELEASVKALGNACEDIASCTPGWLEEHGGAERLVERASNALIGMPESVKAR